VASNVEKEMKMRNRGSGDCSIELNPLFPSSNREDNNEGNKFGSQVILFRIVETRSQCEVNFTPYSPLPRAYHLSLLGMASLFAHLLGHLTKVGGDFGVVLSWTSIGQES
jgi:hypothetical protein